MNATARVCPDPGEIARSASQGANAELQAHLTGCARCAEDWRVQRELARLGTALPFTAPEPGQQRRLRADLLAWVTAEAGAPPPLLRPPRRSLRPLLLAGAVGAAAAAALLFLIVRPVGHVQAPVAAAPPAPPAQRPPVPRPPAHLRASPGARYLVESGPPNERVRLIEGRLIAEVTPARAGETFRIVTARGEVEVRGTIFETVATTAGLQAVRVERGRVVVRPDVEVGTEITLIAGQRWQRASERAATPAPAPVVRRAAAERRPSAPASHWQAAADVPRPATGDGPAMVWPELDGKRPPAGPAGAEAAFGSGLQLLRTGHNAAAADAFDSAAALAPTGPLAEDAWYWRAVALARAGAATGRVALAQFLDRYPFSARRGEAAVMLGWVLLDRGDSAAAERQFRVGLGDRSARVRGSAQAGLDRLAARGSPPR